MLSPFHSASAGCHPAACAGCSPSRRKSLGLGVHHKLRSGLCVSRQPDHLPVPFQTGPKAAPWVNGRSSKKGTEQHDKDQALQFGSGDTRLLHMHTKGHRQPCTTSAWPPGWDQGPPHVCRARWLYICSPSDPQGLETQSGAGAEETPHCTSGTPHKRAKTIKSCSCLC